METRRITSLEELDTIVTEVLSVCTAHDDLHVITLMGDLGAGKTAFTKLLGKQFRVTEEITSPTFVVMKSYAIPVHPRFTTLTHIDAYRIESEDEMRVIGLEALLNDPKRLICIEWPEKISGCIPKDVYQVMLTLNLDGSREVTFGRANE